MPYAALLYHVSTRYRYHSCDVRVSYHTSCDAREPHRGVRCISMHSASRDGLARKGDGWKKTECTYYLVLLCRLYDNGTDSPSEHGYAAGAQQQQRCVEHHDTAAAAAALDHQRIFWSVWRRPGKPTGHAKLHVMGWVTQNNQCHGTFTYTAVVFSALCDPFVSLGCLSIPPFLQPLM